MRTSTKILLSLPLLIPAACSQVSKPGAPGASIKEHAQQVLSDSGSSQCEKACALIAAAMPNAFYLRDEGECHLWDAKQSDLIPSCRVEPSTPEEVSSILKAIAKERCHFAVRGGGHSRIAGSSNAKDGITIDMKRLNQVEVAKDGKTAKLGGGAVWGGVYKTLEKDGLAVVGGRVSDVGVGGFTLGGGLSFLSNRYGWATDSITAFELVLPDGSIKTITHQNDPDIFWALRGGGNNFGIVTAFHSKIIRRKPEVWRATKIYSLENLDWHLAAQYRFISEGQRKDPDAIAFFPYCYHAPYDMLITIPMLFHSTHSSNESWPATFSDWEKFDGVEGTTKVVVKPMSGITDDISLSKTHGMRTIYKTITYRADPEVDKKIIEVYLREVEKVKKMQGIEPCIVFHPTPPGHTKPMSNNGGNPLGLAGEGLLTIMMTSWTWKNKEDDAVNFEINKILFHEATKIARDAGKLVPYIYQNYAWQDQDVFAGYGEENLARLQKIQARIDPEGVFAGGEGGLSRGYFKVNVRDADGKLVDRVRDEL